MTTLAPYVFWQEFDNDGNPLAGGKVYTYEAGTSTPKVTYTDSSGGTPNANPVILDASGRASIWLGDGGYKFILTDANDVTIATRDNVGGASDSAFGGEVNIITTNTTITAVYKNSANLVSGTTTLTLLPVGDAGEGFYISVKNEGVNTVTIDPDAGELIDGAANLTLAPNESALIITDGTEWYSFFLQGGVARVASNNAFTGNNSFAGTSTFTNTITMTGAVINEAKGANIASESTTDIGAATGNFVHITGTTTITSFGTVQAGTHRLVTFDGVLVLTHNATSLILPTGANITTAANDSAVFVSEGSGNWRCVSYQLANGKALNNGFTTSAAQNGYKISPDGIIEQWGLYNGGAHGPTVNFPTTFTTACYVVTATAIGTDADGAFIISIAANPSTTQFTAYQHTGANSDITSSFYWRAIGK